MAKQVGPFATIAEVEQAANLAKRLGVEGTVAYYIALEPQSKANGKASNGKRTKKVTCPVCGDKFEKPQSLGPHSRKHRTPEEIIPG